MTNASKYDLKKYQNLSRKTAIYPEDVGLAYETLGLCSEVGELLENCTAIPHKVDHAKLVGEFGGVLWYTARLCDRLELSMHDVFECGLESAPGMIFLSIYSGLFANKAKKVLRDHKSQMNEESKKAMQNLLINFVASYKGALTKFNLTVDQVAEYNLDQLFSRQERGKLGGDGDDR